jgi:hypothetical protein
LTTGWLIGGSASPVAGTALPVLLGLGVTVSQLTAERRRDKLLASLAHTESDNVVQLISEEMRAEREQSVVAFEQLGKSILAFALPMLLGTLLGGLARVQEWFVDRPSLPWSTLDKVSSVEELSGLLASRAQLASQDFAEEDIAKLLTKLHDLDGKQRAVGTIWEKAENVDELEGLLVIRAQLVSQGFAEEEIARLIEKFHVLDVKQRKEDEEVVKEQEANPPPHRGSPHGQPGPSSQKGDADGIPANGTGAKTPDSPPEGSSGGGDEGDSGQASGKSVTGGRGIYVYTRKPSRRVTSDINLGGIIDPGGGVSPVAIDRPALIYMPARPRMFRQ